VPFEEEDESPFVGLLQVEAGTLRRYWPAESRVIGSSLAAKGGLGLALLISERVSGGTETAWLSPQCLMIAAPRLM